MHELSIVEALLHEAETAAARHGLATVKAVGVRVGRHSGVATEALATAFEILREGRLLGSAVLNVESTSGADLQLAWIEGD